MTPRTDEELVAAFKEGEQTAADELVHRHAGPLGRFLKAAGADLADLEDVAQEAFFKAFRAIEHWRAEASFRSWLFKIAVNLSRDRSRRRKGRVSVPIDDLELADGSDPAGEADARDLEERLQRELASLPRLQREVFLLRAQQGLQYEEICSALGTTPGAARVHYHHAVKRLKEAVS